jgi:uncharacterized protein YdeI (YjbR/CyaY-like superfamily)
VVETLKWSMPSFEYKGILCGMAAFKAHCTFGFWRGALLAEDAGARFDSRDEAMGQFGRITALSDLPPDRVLLGLVRKAVAIHDRGEKVPAKPRPGGDRALKVPAYFMTALRADARALATFKGLSPSHRREYVEWVTEAKTEATRERRLATAIAWMAEGKVRNWKYVRR